MRKAEIDELKQTIAVVMKDAITGSVKKLKYEFEKIGIRRRERWFYQLTENLPERTNFLVQTIIFFWVLKKASYASFEWLWINFENWIRQPEIVGVPNEPNGLQLVSEIEARLELLKKAVKR